MTTCGNDGFLKIFDVRTYKELHSYWVPSTPNSLAMSQKRLLAVSYQSNVMIWKDWHLEKQKKPYMKQGTAGDKFVVGMQFAPYEDFLGLGLDDGFESMLVPGSGDPNFDSFEENPFARKKQ